MKELCLQQKLGSCLGCPVLETAIGKAQQTRDVAKQDQIAQKVGKKLCPTGGEISIPNAIRDRGRLIVLMQR